jgi:hypothetical protein
MLCFQRISYSIHKGALKLTGADDLKRKQQARFAVLEALYESDGGAMSAIFLPEKVAPALSMDVEEVQRIFTYLNGEGLIKIVTLGMGVMITHAGVVEVERYIENPERGTEHFNFSSLTQNFYSTVGVNQIWRPYQN